MPSITRGASTRGSSFARRGASRISEAHLERVIARTPGSTPANAADLATEELTTTRDAWRREKTMATIQLTDQFGLNIQLDPNPTSVFNKYVKGLSAAGASIRDGKDISADTVAGYPFTTQSLGLSFQQPVPLGTTGVELTINPSVSGSITLGSGADVLDQTLFATPDAAPLMDQNYLSAALEASLEGDLGKQFGDLQFGFGAGTNVVLTYSQPVNPTDKLASALKTTLENFTIPGDLEDLKGMDKMSIAAVQGTGTLTFAGALNVLTVTNPLATIATGITALGNVGLIEGGTIGVSASLAFTGGYEVQVCKLDATRILLGFSRTKGRQLDANITGEIGISAAIGNFDVIKILLQTVSPDAVPPIEDLKKAGVSDEEITAISNAIQAAIQRSLQVSLTGELDLSDENTKAFLYEIDLSALKDVGRKAVHSAIDGDLSALEAGGLEGVKTLRSVIGSARERTRKLTVNLLGILNFGSVRDMLQISTFVVDPDTGDISIVDETVASNVGLTVNNFAKDGAKLRRVVADGFLATCAYRTSQTGLHTSIASKCWAFAAHQKTNLDQIQDYLNIAVSLGLVTPEDAAKQLAGVRTIQQFGRSMFQADSSYDDTLCRTLFLDGAGEARPQEYYERRGREAMAATLSPRSPTNQARLLPLNNDALWSKMSEGGQTTFATLFSDRNEVEVAVITSDYTIIKWWASAMNGLGQSLSKLLRFVNASGVTDPNNNTFIALRGDLDKKLKAVAQQTHDQFSEPWGLVAMDMASDRHSQTNLLIICPWLSLSLARPIPAPRVMTAGA